MGQFKGLTSVNIKQFSQMYVNKLVMLFIMLLFEYLK